MSPSTTSPSCHRPLRFSRSMMLCLSLVLASATAGRAQPVAANPRLTAGLELAAATADTEERVFCDAQHSAAAFVCCDGEGGFDVCRARAGNDRLVVGCIHRHEEDHLRWFAENLPRECEARPRGACRFTMTAAQFRELECSGYQEEFRCLTESRPRAFGRHGGFGRLLARQRQLRLEAEARFACALR